MTPAQLDRLLALADAATPGPWRVGAELGAFDSPMVVGRGIEGHVADLLHDADAAFIAAANPDTIRALVQGFADTLDEVERLSQIERTARHMAVFDQPDGSSAEDAMAQLRAALEPKP